jgi:leucyl-tRNA synthetase
VPVWIADYVLADYGTGAVMAVPAHDERDGAFAKKYGLPIKHVIAPLVRKTTGDDAFRSEIAISERNAAVCVIKHWSEDKYLGVRWKKTGWQAFVVGGIEKDEDAAQAAVREAREETGYQNIEVEKAIPGIVHAQFYQVLKKENRLAHFYPVILKLKDGTYIEPAEEEKALQDSVWLTPKEMDAFITHEDMRIVWNWARGDMTYTGEGILVDSKKFTGKNSGDVKKEITESVGGNWVTKFKLRDWVFSRQRYWGEPIPVVHCVKHGVVPLPESELPLKLPPIKNYKPTATGESPLAAITKWVETTCPTCVEEKNKPQYFIFDFDGVLGDTWDATVEARFKMGDHKTKEEVISGIMKYFDSKPFHTRDAKRTEEQHAKSLEWTRVFGKNMLEQEIELFGEFIKEIKKYKNAKMAVVSTGSRQYIIPLLKKAGIKFTHVLAFEDHHSKEEKIEQICKDWKIGIKDAHYFTDTKADVYELENLLDRSKIIGCAWGFHGVEKLKEVLPENQILKGFKDIHTYFNTDCKARRETDTMPNWAGSSWYYLRYLDIKNTKAFADPKKLKYWTPVDWYNGGMEHTTLHLLYSRFWHKFLFDLKLVPTTEPYQKRTSHGLILAKGGEKMSKSKGNVINPDTLVTTVGADALRVYEMFMGPFEQHIAWDENGIVGTRRFIEKVWRLRDKVGKGEFAESQIHKTIKKVSDDIEGMRFNTAISSMMILVNEMEKATSISIEQYQILLQLLSPFAPHVTEELWADLGNKKSIFISKWPEFDPSKITETTVKIMVQVNGKVRAEFESVSGARDDEVKNTALNMAEIKKWTEGKDIKKIIVVKGRLVNIVV